MSGLNTGADEYLVKPFAMAELVARLEAVCRRTFTRPATTLSAGPLQLDLATRSVTRDGEAVDLTPTEFSLLEFLMRHAGQVVTRKMNVEVETDPELLKRIAKETGGEFFSAGDADSLRQIFERIDRLERSEIKLSAYRRYEELYRPFLLGAVALLCAAAAVHAAGLRVLPA